MKSILISIQPKWCELIASGKKTVEIRKTRPKIAVPFKCYIYQTKKPVAVSFSGTGKHISEYDKTYFYNDRSGRVIGEFVCDRIQKYECEFVDDNCYEEIASIFQDEDGDETGFIEWSNDSHTSYENTDLYEESRVTYKKLKKYMGMGFGTFYGWHISDLVIYEQPRELGEFFKYCGENPKCEGCEAHYYSNTECGKEDYCCSTIEGHRPLKRPPQSWCYVERKEDEGK